MGNYRGVWHSNEHCEKQRRIDEYSSSLCHGRSVEARARGIGRGGNSRRSTRTRTSFNRDTSALAVPGVERASN